MNDPNRNRLISHGIIRLGLSLFSLSRACFRAAPSARSPC